MKPDTRLYDAFGELIYATALADGLIQQEEITKITEVLEAHPWGKDIQWSFDYEARKGNNPKDSYEKALDVLKAHGPDPDYRFLVEILEQIAEASQGIDSTERQVIEGFQESLMEHFRKYLNEHSLLKE